MSRYRLYEIVPCDDCYGQFSCRFCRDGTREVRTEVVVEKLPHWQTWYAEVNP